MRTLLIDNHDSFTFNLFQLMARTYGVAPVVVPNDHLELTPALADGFDAVVISPGPGRPEVARDIGRCLETVRASRVPVLGVCLGHQALGHLVGAEVTAAPTPQHGHLTTVRHHGTGLFADLPAGFTAVRYHSLCLSEPLPEALTADAWSEDGVVMGIRHRSRPWWGVQFHPESIASEYGEQLLSTFRDLVVGRTPRRAATPAAPPTAPPAPVSAAPPGLVDAARSWMLLSRRLPYAVDPETVFDQLCSGRPYAFWLDGCHPSGELSRFSLLGHPGGPGGEVLSYDTSDGFVVVRDADGRGVDRLPGTITDVLSARLIERRVRPAPELPFGLKGGYVGYFGYELKADVGAAGNRRAATADAVWTFASRYVAIDHEQRSTWVVSVCRDTPTDIASAQGWLDRTAAELGPAADRAGPPPGPASPATEPLPVCPPRRYLDSVVEAQEELRAGQSYEVCLTTEVTAPFRGDAHHAYLRQRRLNPAPYSAFLQLGPTQVLCSSPERFLRIDEDGAVESRPIKGTAPRGGTAAADEVLRTELATAAKTRAENLMIVDLLRNDLGRVCEIGSVHVPSFMAVESYATVHQLVSTVRGRLRPDVDPVAAVRACFPGGSMTGAPKLRTMEIIDRLEGRPRGIYSGALGYFGLTGAADLNIVIRTVVVAGGRLSAGAGGAIVLASDPAAEYEEMLLKMRAALCGVMVDEGAPASR